MFQLLSNLALTQFGQVTLLVLLVGLLHRLLAERLPSLMLWVWTLVLVKAVTPPVFSSPVGVFSWFLPHSASRSSSQPLATLDLAPADGWLASAGTLVLVTWAAGSLALLGLLILRKQRLARLLRRDALESDDPLTIYTDTLAERYGLRKPARVVVSQDNYGPAVTGVIKPTIVFPASLLSDRNPAVLRPVLLHELVHIGRRDTLNAMLGAVARIVWWFNPAIWWATRQAEQLVERCVDLQVTRDLETSLFAYGRGLLRVLELRAGLQADSAAVGLRPCQITTERLEFLRRVDERSPFGRPRPSRWAPVTRFAMFATLAAVLLPALPTEALLPTCSPACVVSPSSEPHKTSVADSSSAKTP